MITICFANLGTSAVFALVSKPLTYEIYPLTALQAVYNILYILENYFVLSVSILLSKYNQTANQVVAREANDEENL